jgi:hypothetical protein
MFVTDSKIVAGVAELPTRALPIYVETDGGAHYDVWGAVPGMSNVWFVRARVTRAWGIATLTSRVLWARPTVRIRFDMAVDTGDMAGTLEFSGATFGGRAWTGSLASEGLLTY